MSEFGLSLFTNEYMVKQAKESIIKTNEYTKKFGLSLNEKEALLIVKEKNEALRSFGRVEFGAGISEKIIMEFADSPYLMKDDYVETIIELQDIFYYFKNESLDELTDDELLKIMKYYYDHDCQGDLGFLQSTLLENVCRSIRYGKRDFKDKSKE